MTRDHRRAFWAGFFSVFLFGYVPRLAARQAMTKNSLASMLGQTAAAETSRNLVAEIDYLRKRNAELHAQLLRAQCELEKIRTLADLERINPIRYRSEA